MIALVTSNVRPAWSTCVGCGSSGGTLSPCPKDGEVIYDWTGEVFGTPNGIWHEVRTWVGTCPTAQIHQVVKRVSDGFVSIDSFMSAGCPCSGPDSPYNVSTHPSFDIDLLTTTPTTAVLHSPKALASLSIVNVNNGATVFVHGAVALNDTVQVPLSVMNNSVYAVEGFVPGGRLDGSAVLHDFEAKFYASRRLMIFGDDSTGTVRNLVVYLNNGNVKIVRQHLNNSLEIVSGTTGTFSVPGSSKSTIMLLSLLLGAAGMWWAIKLRSRNSTADLA